MLGNKIKELRTLNSMSQKDLADKLNLERSTISKWETNKSTPSIDDITKLSEVFNISVDELLVSREKESSLVIKHFKTTKKDYLWIVVSIVLVISMAIVFYLLNKNTLNYIMLFIIDMIISKFIS